MAKQLVGPLERHVDKAVLGVAGLVLLGVIAKYAVTSPNQIEMGRERVSPHNIDGKVLAKAADLRRTIQDAEPPEKAFDPMSPEFEAALRPFGEDGIDMKLSAVVPIGPEVPLVGRAVPVESYIKLVEVVKLPKPTVVHGRSSVMFEGIPELESDFGIPVNWATVSAIFDRQEQMKRQRVKYLPGNEKVFFGNVELERRAMRPDGTWSDDDWEFVDPLPMEITLPKLPDIKVIERDGVPNVAQEVWDDVAYYFRKLEDSKTQLDLIRPMPPVFRSGDPWDLPEITKRMDVLRMDDELLYPKEPPSAYPEDRYPDAPTADDAYVGTDTMSEQDKIKQWFKQADELFARANEDLSLDLLTQANNLWVEVVQNAQASARDKERANKLIRRCDQARLDIERQNKRRAEHGSGGEDSTGRGSRPLLPRQQVWAHDMFPDSASGGRIYQYRIRALIYNRYVAKPKKLADPLDATNALIAGEWSEPSDPIYVLPDREFFLTNAFKGRSNKPDEIAVEMFQWFEGHWVKNSRARFQIGDKVVREARAKIPVPDDPELIDNALVPFAVDAMLVDIDTERARRARKRVGKGVKFQPASSGEAVAVFVDSAGNIFERAVSTDKSHPARGSAKVRLWKPPKAGPAEGPRPKPGP